ncbi:haloacid dehalogenase-like hydrolase [Jeotgalicoccus aerolatus]|uniref:HAD superfamily phosphatase (TIGR01668 family) n=1 Tax=Jeotgalicoccus aerolatus TaxID=709510 RepID=A0A1G8UJG8_9STAP|nr:YqeG family HAD IIIA-type phosphatase [Jeotgalicoccus aerolatus]MBP1951658.1 HAD superfamily phosphatase (TIGR01668 family) [Jeotgalicoccus aerolatus]NMA81068.1 YqeG family HAD IIIA-type phosphatase [Jeotgalicoccus aerolatus]CAD2075732.1 haloacid dehalogenase-like hydrolase [Jeotgalicoccus aerolatus]SDJ53637.1 hypothetical protein SAMN05216187_10113 [Jeotgalicoccus aerolatus]GGD95813.1 hypothetical protein GCM10007273_05180 [Jeotgalicoccus aerolatus]
MKIIEDKFLPSHFVKRYEDITPEFLRAHNIKAVMTDLDNTLVAFDAADADDNVLKWIKTLNESNIKLLILSNGNKKRVSAFAEPHGIEYIAEAKKPMLGNFHQGLKLLGTKKKNTIMVGDQLMTDVLGANRANINSILVVPVKEKDGWATYLNRRIERVIMKYFRSKNMINWED